jgi:hypothetical protein
MIRGLGGRWCKGDKWIRNVSLPPWLHGLSISNTKAFNPSTICQSYGAGGAGGAGKSMLCEENRYLLELVHHIHLNPMRAVIKDPGGIF